MFIGSSLRRPHTALGECLRVHLVAAEGGIALANAADSGRALAERYSQSAQMPRKVTLASRIRMS